MSATTYFPPVAGDRVVPWLDQMPLEWAFQPLKYLVQINARTLGERTDPETAIDYIDISSVDSDGRVIETAELTFGMAPSRARRLLLTGDVFISTVRTYLTAIAFCEAHFDGTICSTGFAVLTPGDQVVPRFLFYWVRASNFVDEIVARSTGVSYPAINASEIGNLPFPLLPLEQQRAIADYLDRKTAEIDALIARKRRMIDLLHEQRQALISEAVTKGLDPDVPMRDSGIPWLGSIPSHWKIRAFKHCGTIPSGQIDPRLDQYKTSVLIAPNHIEPKTGRLAFRETVTEQAAISGKYKVRKGDVVYSKIRPELQKACLAPEDCLCSADMYPITPAKDMDAGWILYTLLCDWFTEYAVLFSDRVAMPKVNRETLGYCTMLVPPIDEQLQIVAAIEQRTKGIDSITDAIDNQIGKLLEYRQTLISAAATGKLQVALPVGSGT